VGVVEEIAAADGKEGVELVVGDDALVDGFVAAENVVDVASGGGWGIAVEKADARKGGVEFVVT